MFGVDSTTISSILNRKIYQHLTSDYDFSKVKKSDRLSIEKIQKVCEKLSSGKTVREISLELDVSISTLTTIKARKIHTFISDSYEW
jgi:DNA-binding NarL/FixJ family response regulator